MTTVARCAFATLSVSAKLHRILDAVGDRSGRGADALAFDAQVTKTLAGLSERPGALQREAKHAELALIKRDFGIVAQLYKDYAAHEQVPESLAQRFERIFSDIEEKIEQKERVS